MRSAATAGTWADERRPAVDGRQLPEAGSDRGWTGGGCGRWRSGGGGGLRHALQGRAAAAICCEDRDVQRRRRLDARTGTREKLKLC